MYRTVFWTLCKREREMVGWFGRMALKHVYYHMWNGSPVQVRCMIQGARGWCTGMIHRDGMRREVGGGFRMGNTYTPMADSCQCMAKPIQYCKVRKKNPLVGKIPWRRKWQPTPLFLPGKFHGQRSLMGHSPWVTKSWIRLSTPTCTFHTYMYEIYIYIFLSALIVC